MTAKAALLPVATIGFAWLISLARFSELPVPLAEGTLPATLARALVAFCLPTAAIVTYLILRRLGGEIVFEPGVETTADTAHRALGARVVFFIVALHLVVLLSLSGVPWVHSWEPRLVVALFGGVFIVIGNLLPRTRPNLAFGIRTARTLTDRRLWIVLHRTCGYVAVAFGTVVVIAGLFLRHAVLGFVIGAAAITSTAALAQVLMSRGSVTSSPRR